MYYTINWTENQGKFYNILLLCNIDFKGVFMRITIAAETPGPKLWEQLFGQSTKGSTNKYYNDLVDKYTANPSKAEYYGKLIEDFDDWRNRRFANLGVNMKKQAGPTLDKPNFDFVAYAEKMKNMTNDQIIYSIQDAKQAEQAMRNMNPKAEMWYRDEWLTLADELRRRNKVSSYKTKILKLAMIVRADLIIIAAARPYDPDIQGDIKGWNLYNREWEFTKLDRPDAIGPTWRLKPKEESLVGKVSELMEKDGIYYAVVNGVPYNISEEVSFGIPGEKEIHKIKKAPPMPDEEESEAVEPQRAFGGIKMDYRKKITARVKNLKEEDGINDRVEYRNQVTQNMAESGKCDHCPPHGGENSRKKARPDKYKNKVRETIRKDFE
jgi:hypothetical protein